MDCASSQKIRPKARLYDIDRLKGLGILLVVYGHLLNPETFECPAWYSVSKDIVYQFHMPLFMYLSGLIFFYSKRHLPSDQRIWGFFAARSNRLLVPFFVSAIVILIGKYLISRFAQVDDSVESLMVGFWRIISNHPNNPAFSVWYLLVLFVYCALSPYLWRLVSGNGKILLALALMMHLFPIIQRFYLAQIAHYYTFFVLGALAIEYFDRWRGILECFGAISVVVFVLSWWPLLHTERGLLVTGLLSLPALHYLIQLEFLRADKILLYLGTCSMAIYLMNTIFIGVAKLIYVKLVGYDGEAFIALAIVLMVMGTAGPIVVKYFVDNVRVLAPVRRYLA